MRTSLLRRKEKAPRQEKILSEIDRLVSWEKLARCAEPCLDETPEPHCVKREALEALVRMTVLNRCFGFAPEAIPALPGHKASEITKQEDLDRFIRVIAGCSLRLRIMRELDAQLSKVGVCLDRKAAFALL